MFYLYLEMFYCSIYFRCRCWHSFLWPWLSPKASHGLFRCILLFRLDQGKSWCDFIWVLFSHISHFCHAFDILSIICRNMYLWYYPSIKYGKNFNNKKEKNELSIILNMNGTYSDEARCLFSMRPQIPNFNYKSENTIILEMF